MPAFGAFMALFLLSGTMPAHVQAPDVPPLPSYSVKLTGYNAVPEQTKPDPSTTADGGPSNPEVVAARSRDLALQLPFGTIIEIVGPAAKSVSCGYGAVVRHIGYRVITDSMNEHITNTVDVLFDTQDVYALPDGRTINASTLLGVCQGTTIRVVGSIDLSNPDDLPQTQAELASLVSYQSGGHALAVNKQ